jgi:pilus assembly protein CpaE
MANRILLVSPDGTVAQTVAPMLEQRGLSVAATRDVNAALARLDEFQLVILDASDAPRLALLIRQINDVAGSRHPPILAIGHSSDVDERVRLLEAGADDVLSQPIDDGELEALVEALLLRAPGVVAQPTTRSEAAATRPGQAAPGRVIVFAAAKGGSGTTTLAVNTALVLAELAPRNVAIADLDMHHGQVSTHLDIYAGQSTAQLARSDMALNSEDLLDAGKQHASGLMVFGGPYRPDEGNEITGSQLGALTDTFRTSFGTTVVDAGSVLDMRTVSLLSHADAIVMTLTPDIPALRLLHAALQVISEVGPLADRATFVVNDVYPRRTIAAEQIEEHLGIKVGLAVPYDGENCLRAINEGHPLISIAPRSPTATAIRRLAEMASEIQLVQDLAQPQKKGRLSGLLRR